MRVHELVAAIKQIEPKSIGDDLISQSIKFDLGRVSSVAEMAAISSSEMCKPPYPVSLFQFEVDGDSHIVLLMDDGEGVSAVGYGFQPSLVGPFWYKEDLMIRCDGYDLTTDCKITEISTGKPLEGASDNLKAKGWWISRILGIMSAMEVLACSNVAWIDNPAPKLINKARVKKGKVPLYSYKTLHILANESGEKVRSAGNGKHASPRVHLRRGHIRRLQSGKRVWVQSCVVGDKSRGVVAKDYAVSMH